ncbi:MAG: HEPN domain-containing protein [Ignavibacteriae bacterium]|nr:HEPN domain-containing protein [Ignavibacteriota bacterium]
MGYKPFEEWFTQADYDMDTAQAMFDAGRYIYCIFMIHLSIEKTLKGLWAKNHQQDAPKTHDLIYLVNKLQINPPEEIYQTISEIDEVSVPTRYPEILKALIQGYPKERTGSIFSKSKKVHEWLKIQ